MVFEKTEYEFDRYTKKPAGPMRHPAAFPNLGSQGKLREGTHRV
jgi:hypothetical protein